MQKLKDILKNILSDKKRLLVFSGVVLIVLIFILSKGCGKSSTQQYKFAAVQKGVVEKTISVTGSLKIIDEYIVLSKVGGMVEQVYVDFNNYVKRGKVLAVIDSTNIDRAIMKQKLSLDNYTMVLNSNKKQMKSKEKQYKDGYISKQAYLTAKKSYISAYNTFKSIQVDYWHHLKTKRNARIKAPVSGTIINVAVKPHVPIRVNHRCFAIAPTLKRMQLIITVDESDIGFIKRGQKVAFTVGAFPNKNFSG